MERIVETVEKVQRKAKTVFTIDELAQTLCLTRRKMELNRQDDDYFFILLENELYDLLTRKAITTMSYR